MSRGQFTEMAPKPALARVSVLLVMSRGQPEKPTGLSPPLGRCDMQACRGEDQVIFRFLDVVPSLGIEQQRFV